jgi:hypothetical protein
MKKLSREAKAAIRIAFEDRRKKQPAGLIPDLERFLSSYHVAEKKPAAKRKPAKAIRRELEAFASHWEGLSADAKRWLQGAYVESYPEQRKATPDPFTCLSKALAQAATYRGKHGRREDAERIMLLFGLISVYEKHAGRVSVHEDALFMQVADAVLADVFPDATLSCKAVQRAVKLYRSLS